PIHLPNVINMPSRDLRSPRRLSAPRTTSSNPELSLNYMEELLYVSTSPDTTNDLQRTRAASESVRVADELEASSGTSSLPHHPSTPKKHAYGRPCPDGDSDCHWHHQQTQYCHVPWNQCSLALNAIKQSYRAGGEWIGAPEGWNKAREPCLVTAEKCKIHAEVDGMHVGKQRNKKYPEKPRVRGRENRGTGNQKKT
ncbi:unnamed protein product, partial [Aureobasidium vineae]